MLKTISGYFKMIFFKIFTISPKHSRSGKRWFQGISILAILIHGLLLIGMLLKVGIIHFLEMLVTAVTFQSDRLDFNNGALAFVVVLMFVYGILSLRLRPKSLYLYDLAVLFGLFSIVLGARQVLLFEVAWIIFWLAHRLFLGLNVLKQPAAAVLAEKVAL
ncbi:hypothetical protein UNSWDHB_1521 [Dehalobacter sp. UNSWDHB]|jgi:hypothetical protein|uniref:hypothetical protein n=1 Tax=unclassified Dehalobacter TaxID=2635733 RepID=UPI00028AA737|nr:MULTISPECIES: hypothetical protein [unclassified Dehalobacter]AFV03150.1 hypothetical protein DHBDCA_p2123 [Dehalobacter sp. DCA]AFV06140.1 hypothetical protein DCF50_p2137 [Dehalobacter sp. CF]EQB21133.1 hypothetical protein UNSWDHB_1521 [Dehalobacter sp. UNSWDHB]